MTPERQKELQGYLSELSSKFSERLCAENVDAVDARMMCLEQVLCGHVSLTEMLWAVGKSQGLEARRGMEKFITASAAMTVATYLSKVTVE